ncbi:AAA family ATPase [Aeromonas allosaccharophila]|uniref:AAA family ATPase n=1 Tax=Aeromonas allosaccharophila TaxID=656 RepID=UPI000DD09576|nr:AAA family ATPase [Aeromonas allosaccharophila]
MGDKSNTYQALHVRFGEFELNEQNAQLLLNGTAMPLSPIPFSLLCTLVRQPNVLLTKHALLDLVWGHRFVSNSVLKGAISDIRNVLRDDPRQPRYIETVSRRGYRFICTTLPCGDSSGLNQPVSATGSTLVIPPSAALSLPSSAQRTLFVGRANELERLQYLWGQTVHGHRAIVWIAGEPGIGKTTLIEHFVAGLRDVLCVRGQCVQLHGAGEPYLPVLEALGELCRRDEKAVALLSVIAPTWLLQLPWLCSASQREALLRELVGANPQRMLREMGEFMDRYTEQQPLLLITEDLHWGDHSTVQLIDYLARRRGSSRLMWLGSVRLADVIAQAHPLNEIRHELRPQGLCHEILLDSFSELDVAAYVAERMPTMALEEAFVRALYERTSGVPLFVTSLATEVLTKAVPGNATRAEHLIRTRVPETLGALIDHYVVKLSGVRRQLLATAAVFGMSLRVDKLARVLEWDAALVADLCDQLAHERLWLTVMQADEDGDELEFLFAFRHELFRQRLYEGLSTASQVMLHGKIGAVLAEDCTKGRGVTAAELAMHFDRGREYMISLRYYADAAQAALIHLCPSECMSLTERALAVVELLPQSAERHAFEITLATLRGSAAFHLLGAGEETRQAYQRAVTRLVELPAHPMAGLALHGYGLLLDFRAEYNEALEIAARARSLAAERGDPLLALAACTVQGQALMMQGHYRLARETLESALPTLAQSVAIAEHNLIGFIADPQVTVQALLSVSLAQQGLFDQSRQRLLLAYGRARQLGQPMALLVTIWCDALCGIRYGDVARVAALAGEMRSLVEEYSLAQGKAACRWFQGWADSQCGKPLEGAQQIRKAYEDNRALGMLSGSSETLGYLAEAFVLQGEWRQAREPLDEALLFVHRYGERVVMPQLLLVQGALEWAGGRVEAAIASARSARVEAIAQGAPWLELLALTTLGEYQPLDQEECVALARLLEQFAQAGDPPLLARARTCLAKERPAR